MSKGTAMIIKKLTVLIDQDGNECLYIDGKCWQHTGETTVYAVDLAEAADGEAVTLDHVPVTVPEDAEWPTSLEDALKWKIEN